MNALEQDDRQDTRLKQAADWLARLNGPEVDEQAAAQWLEWCQSDPENLSAFEHMRALWLRFDDRRLSEALAKDARAPERASSPLQQALQRPDRMRLARAAGLLLAVGFSAWFAFRGVEEGAYESSYSLALRTDVASLQSESLPDGSRVELSARSAVRVRFTPEQRRVVVEEGEAFFDVRKNRTRPFVVQAGALQVTAVGTAFNVRKSFERVVVSVQEGVVRVESIDPATAAVGDVRQGEAVSESRYGQLRAGAGHQVIYSSDERTLTMVRASPGATAAWRSGRLEFVNEPLGSVVADLNRYWHRPIRLEGPRAQALTYTGTVRSDAIEDWLDAVEDVFPVRVADHGAGGIVIEDRPPR